MQTTIRNWRSVPGIAPWFLVEAVLPGAALFLLVLWLSLEFLRGGFADIRQYAQVPAAPVGRFASTIRKAWWSCTCLAACACLASIRLCCKKEKARVTAGFFGELATVTASTRP